MTVQIVSAIFGDFDTPHRPMRQSIDCEWTMVTDTPGLVAPGWNVVTVEPSDLHPRMAAKEPKLWPWEFACGDGPWIWLDGAFEVLSSTFAAEAVAATEGHVLGQWRHPWRDCALREALVVDGLVGEKYAGYPALAQADAYRRSGHPAGWGLWATGLIVYTERCEALAGAWWSEMDRWGYQDQISQPYVLRNVGLRPVDLPGGLHASPWMRWHQHRSNA